MPLVINGAKKRVQGDIKQRILRELELIHNAGHYIRILSVNGTEAVVEDVKTRELSREDFIRIETCTLEDLVEDTLYTANDVLPLLYHQLSQAVDALRIGEIGEASSQFASALEGLKWNITVLDKICNLRDEHTSVHEVRDTGFTLIPPLMGAYENEDYVSVADILEYEVFPWLNRWFNLTELFKNQMQAEKVKRGLTFHEEV